MLVWSAMTEMNKDNKRCFIGMTSISSNFCSKMILACLLLLSISHPIITKFQSTVFTILLPQGQTLIAVAIKTMKIKCAILSLEQIPSLRIT